MPRPCPTCGGPITLRSATPARPTRWHTFWAGWTVCPSCRTPLRLDTGLVGQLGLGLAHVAAAGGLYLLVQSLPTVWAVAAFLLMLAPALVAATTLWQAVRWAVGRPVADLPAATPASTGNPPPVPPGQAAGGPGSANRAA